MASRNNTPHPAQCHALWLTGGEDLPNREGLRAHPSRGGAPFFVGESDSPATRRWATGKGLSDKHIAPAPAPDRPSPRRGRDAVAVAGAVGVLDKNTRKVSPLPHSVARRERYRLRDTLQAITANPRVAKCGRCRVRPSVEVHLGPNGRAHYSGLASCGSVWLCPVCAAKVDARRAEEVSGILQRHLDAGGGAYFITLTLPHHSGDRLTATRRLVSRAWQLLQRGTPWLRLKARLGVVGFIRALEVTHGGNGWHPHLHILVLTTAPLSPEAQTALDAYAFAKWCDGVTAQGHALPTRDGFRLEVVGSADVGAYVTKMGAALELTHGAHKKGRRASRTPFQILADFQAGGDEADLALWLEYERATKGARRLTWSRGLKAQYAVPEVSDEELAQAEVGGELVAAISADEWRGVVAFGARVAILEAAERDGVGGVSRLLADLASRPYPPIRLAG